ncbi:MAG: GNAT family N-acetyltransferase [Pseudomonadota bacterium]
MTPRIRQATPEDTDAVRQIAQAAYAPYVAAIGRKPAPMVADFGAQIAQGAVWVAQAQDVLGFIAFFPRGDHMFLENVAVHPGAHGQGIGRLLIAQCEEAARGQHLASVELYTNARMTANLALYPRLGYVETERRVEDGFDRVYFRKVLM